GSVHCTMQELNGLREIVDEYEEDCYWYHTDHLGSSSWITYTDGSAVQHLHYLPWGEDFVDQRTTNWHALHTFSAKERDSETGLSYFGSRYYSSDLSIWLSVDPMAAKYPSLSPYVYCADNPIKLVDPNGEDFETEIDYDNKTITITIKATYYTANCNKELLQKGVDMWNNQSGMYSYVMGEGDNAVSCTIKFELLIAEGNFETDADAFKAMPMGQSSNFVSLIDNVLDDNENEVRGKCDGKIAYISNNQSLSGFNQPRTIAHELGHTLGCGDMSVRGDLMESGGFGSSISTNDIRSIMYMAGYDNLGAIRVSQGKSCDKPQSGDFTGYVRKN
ncbi:MAG: RHS repeat-associated core domain-containing protein, partial [Bacteroidales bacterium]|nr:RHS repeat-associated core domain-containing protein [Bacteroidales bacterium]